MKRGYQFTQLKINGDMEAGMSIKLLNNPGLTVSRCVFWGTEVHRVGQLNGIMLRTLT